METIAADLRTTLPSQDPDMLLGGESQVQEQDQDQGTGNAAHKKKMDGVWAKSRRFEYAPFKDTTQLLLVGAQALETSQLLMADGFGLWEAMAASEIMQPKFDMAMAQPDILAITATKLNPKDITTASFSNPKHTLWILDNLMTKEAGWLTAGDSMTQSIFTCVLLHQIHSVSCPILRPALLAVCKIVSLIKETIMRANSYEDDEIVVSSGGFSLADELTDQEAIKGLDRALEILDILSQDDTHSKPVEDTASLFDCSAASNATGNEKINLDPSWKYDDIPDRLECINALVSRLKFRKSMLSALAHVSKSRFSHCKDHFSDTLEFIPSILSSISLAEPREDIFNPHINRKLHYESPPRQISSLSPSDSYSAYTIMIQQSLESLHVYLKHDPMDFLFIWQYIFNTATKSPSPNIFARAITKIAIHSKINSSKPITSSLQSTLLSLYSVTDKTPKASKECIEFFFKQHSRIDSFVEDVERLFVKVVDMLGYNPSKQRRELRKVITEFENVQERTEVTETHLLAEMSKVTGHEVNQSPMYYLSCWIYDLKLDLLIKHVVMGFELDLYSEFEIPMMFWYFDHLLDSQLLQLTRLLKNKREDCHSGYLYFKAQMVQAKQALVRGLHLMSWSFFRDGMIKGPDPAFYNESLHFTHRFKVSQWLSSPLPVTLDMFNEIRTEVLSVDTMTLMGASVSHFEEAKTRFFHLSRELKCHSDSNVDLDKIIYTEYIDTIHSLLESTLTNLTTAKSIVQTYTTHQNDKEMKLKSDWGMIGVKKFEGGGWTCSGCSWMKWKVAGFPVFGVGYS